MGRASNPPRAICTLGLMEAQGCPALDGAGFLDSRRCRWLMASLELDRCEHTIDTSRATHNAFNEAWGLRTTGSGTSRPCALTSRLQANPSGTSGRVRQAALGGL